MYAERIKEEYPDKMLAYNCSPSFNWKKHLDDLTIARFQKELGAMGYSFQFVTLAGWHAINESSFALARGYAERGMSAYVELQQREFALEDDGYSATRHQREVGAGLFRRRHDHPVGRHGVDPGAGRLHRAGPVRLRVWGCRRQRRSRRSAPACGGLPATGRPRLQGPRSTVYPPRPLPAGPLPARRSAPRRPRTSRLRRAPGDRTRCAACPARTSSAPRPGPAGADPPGPRCRPRRPCRWV